MADEVRARLVYDVSGAERDLAKLERSLDRLEDPINVIVAVDDSQLTNAIEEVTVLREEISSLVGEIAVDDSALIDAEDEAGVLETTLQGLTGDIIIDDSQLTGVTQDVDDLASAIENLPVADVKVDTTGLGEAKEEIDELSASIEGGLGQAASAAGIDVASLGGIVATLASGVSGKATVVAASAATVAAGLDVFIDKAIASESATRRFNLILGDQAEIVSQIDIGGLDIKLTDLAASLGSSGSEAKNAAASFFNIGKAAGAASPQIAETTKQIQALAARAVALDPSLGSVGAVAERMNSALARGGRFAANFALSLNTTEINARAAEISLARGATTVEQFDKIAAGAAISVEKLGDNLSTDIAAGSQNVEFQFRNISIEFGKVVTELGKPLVAPALELLQESQPVMVGVVTTLGSLGKIAIPVIGGMVSALTPLVPILETVGETLTIVGDGATVLIDRFDKAKKSTAEFGETLKLKGGNEFTKGFGGILEALTDPGGSLSRNLDELEKQLEVVFGITPEEQTRRNNAGKSATAALSKAFDDGVVSADQMNAAIQAVETSTGRAATDVGVWNELVNIGAISAGTIADAATRTALKIADAKEQAQLLDQALSDAVVSSDDLVTAISKLGAKLDPIDAARAQAELQKAAIEFKKVASEGFALLPGPNVDPNRVIASTDALDNLFNKTVDVLEVLQKTGGLNAETFAMFKQSFINQAQALGLPADQMGLILFRAEQLLTLPEIKVQVDVEQALAAIEPLTDVTTIMAVIKENPELETEFKTRGVSETLRNHKLIEEARDRIIKEREIELFVSLISAPFYAEADALQGRVSELSNTPFDITVDANTEEAKRKLNELLVFRALFAQGFAIQVHALSGFEAGGVVDEPTLAVLGEGFKKEAVVPEQASLAHQMALLDEIGVLSRLEAQFSAAERARFALLAPMASSAGEGTATSAPLTLEGLAARIEKAVKDISSKTRPVTFVVPPVRDVDEQARLILRKLGRV